MRSWGPIRGTLAEAAFRLDLPHVIRYEREEAVVAGIVHIIVDGREIFRRRIGFFEVTRSQQPFRLESTDCRFTLTAAMGLIRVRVHVGDVEVLTV
jgi:hypothetical protein